MKTSLISGTLVIARKQCSIMGWPATGNSGCRRVSGVPWHYVLVVSHTLGSSIDSGLNRVPREGPPTWCCE